MSSYYVTPARLGQSGSAAEFELRAAIGLRLGSERTGKTAIRGGIGLFYEEVLTVVALIEPAWRTRVGDVFVRMPAACNGVASPSPFLEARSNRPSVTDQRTLVVCSRLNNALYSYSLPDLMLLGGAYLSGRGACLGDGHAGWERA